MIRFAGAMLALGLLAPFAAAQFVNPTTIGARPEDIELKVGNTTRLFTVDDYEGRVLVLYFWRTTNLESVEWLDKLKDLDKRFAPKGVRFMTGVLEQPEKADKVIDEKGVDDILSTNMRLYGRGWAEFFGAMSHPYVVVVDPDGYIAWRGNPNDRFEERLNETLEATNPPSVDAKWLGRKLRAAEKHLDDGEFGKAYTAAKFVQRIAIENSKESQAADSLMGKAETAAADWLKKAIEFERADNLDKATYIVAQISVHFGAPEKRTLNRRDERGQPAPAGNNENERDLRRPVAQDADNEIGRMRGAVKVKDMIRTQLEAARGDVMNTRAADLEERKQYDRAHERYAEVVKKYPDSEPAKAAKAAIERLRTSPAVAEQVKKARAVAAARRLLDLGNRCEQQKLPALARQHYEQLVADHPESPEAKTAAERLKSLPASEAETAQKP